MFVFFLIIIIDGLATVVAGESRPGPSSHCILETHLRISKLALEPPKLFGGGFVGFCSVASGG